MNLAELTLNNIKEFGEYVSLVFEERDYTNVELNRQAECLAKGLQELGMKPGDRLAMMMGNAPEVLVTFAASYKLGTWAMPILFVLQPEEIAHILDDSEVEVCIVHEIFLPKMLEARESPQRVHSSTSSPLMLNPSRGIPRFTSSLREIRPVSRSTRPRMTTWRSCSIPRARPACPRG